MAFSSRSIWCDAVVGLDACHSRLPQTRWTEMGTFGSKVAGRIVGPWRSPQGEPVRSTFVDEDGSSRVPRGPPWRFSSASAWCRLVVNENGSNSTPGGQPWRFGGRFGGGEQDGFGGMPYPFWEAVWWRGAGGFKGNAIPICCWRGGAGILKRHGGPPWD